MLCDKCQNKQICKYYAFLADAPMIINIESCDKYINKTSSVSRGDNNVASIKFRQPIEYPKEIIEEDYEESDEKVFVDLSEEHNTKITSITDLLLGGNNEQKED
jgi:hypothetical protein